MKNNPSLIYKIYQKYYKQYYLDNKKEISQKASKYYFKNKIKIKKRVKKYNQNHKLAIANYQKNYQKKNKKKILLQRKEYFKEYRIRNKKKIIMRMVKYHKIKRKNDIKFKLTDNLRRRLNKAIERNSKNTSMIKLLGCSISQLKQHLERQFKPEMGWKNYGLYGWHIDHIRPCCKFDLTKLSEQKKCFHYSNLQPLWAKENLSKGRSKYND